MSAAPVSLLGILKTGGIDVPFCERDPGLYGTRITVG